MAIKIDRNVSRASRSVRRIAVVIGATGGIGSAVALKLASPETALFLHGHSRGEELKSLGKRLDGGSAAIETFLADLTSEENQNALFDRFVRWAERFPIQDVDSISWINAAGMDLMTPEMKSISFEDRLRRMSALDIVAPVRFAKRFGDWLRANRSLGEKERGAVIENGMEGAADKGRMGTAELSRNDTLIFFGWDGVDRGMEGETAQLYSICKGGIVAFAKSLAQEFAPTIRVLTVSPGWIETTWGEKASERMTNRVRRESLSGRWGRPEEVADLVAFLVSEKASYLNGQNFEINGGFDHRRADF